MLKISVVVCTYNRACLLEQCLASLSRQSIMADGYEVIIVDNNSTDRTQDVVKRYVDDFKHFRCITESRQGLSHARNCGWQEAQGEYVAFIDDDAKATLNWLELIVNAFEKVQPKPVAVGGEIRPFYQAPPPVWFTDYFELRSWGDEAKFLKPSVAMFGFSGSNMAFPKQVLASYGGFNTNLGMKGADIGLGEEADLFFRIYQSQSPLWYDPAICVYHWTPVRNTKISYRVKRAYYAGRSRSQIVGSTLLSWETARELLYLPAFAVVSFVVVCQKQGAKRTELMKLIQNLSNRLGFLIGRM